MSEIIKSEPKTKAIDIAKKRNSLKGLKSTQVTEVVSEMTSRLNSAISKMVNSDKFTTIITSVFDKNPELKECSLSSIFGAVQQVAILGLEPLPVLGYCYFVPYNTSKMVNGQKEWTKEVQFQIGYKGYIELARRSGLISDINAEVVYKGDEFEVSYGLNRTIRHIPKFEYDSPDDILYAYATVSYKDGTSSFAVLTKSQIEKRRMMSPNQRTYNSKSKTKEASTTPLGVWESHYAEMAKGKAVRALATYLPLSTEEKMRMILPDEQVIRRDIDEAPREYSVEEYQDEYDDDYSVDMETGDIQASDDMMSEIEKDAKK